LENTAACSLQFQFSILAAQSQQNYLLEATKKLTVDIIDIQYLFSQQFYRHYFSPTFC
jgi:hypothetical protein